MDIWIQSGSNMRKVWTPEAHCEYGIETGLRNWGHMDKFNTWTTYEFTNPVPVGCI